MHKPSEIFLKATRKISTILVVVRTIKHNFPLKQRPKSAFNGIDFISEYLYNMNHRYPERKQSWTYIFDMKWAKEHLDTHPRPFYPFSLIWSRAYAALKIQAYMRGYWVRRRTDVQEVRTFWKVTKGVKAKRLR